MLSRIRSAVLSLTAVLGLLASVACTGGTVQSEDEPKAEVPAAKLEEVKKLAGANNDFGLEMFRELHKDGSNTFISPLSIAMALQMARQGADGETAVQMDDTLGLDGLDAQKGNRGLLNELNGREGVKLRIANSLWADPGRVNLNEEFVRDVQRYFDSEARAEDFNDPGTVDAINKWVSGRTEGLIPSILSEIRPENIAFLINAIYFKGKWTDPFDPEDTEDAKFRVSADESIDIPLMKRKDDMQYGEVDGNQVVKLPYGDDKQSAMWIVLPDEEAGLDALVKKLDSDSLESLQKAVRKREGTLKLPRFRMGYRSELKGTLQKLGMEKPFESGGADFTRMGHSPQGPIFIGSVLHEAVVIVNEEGTEAAAATVVTMDAESVGPPPFTMVCDRPFLFFITDEPTGSILFMGTVFRPEKAE